MTPQAAPHGGDSAGPADEPRYRWYHVAGAIMLGLFYLELGIFLLVFPWLDFWEHNFFATISPGMREIWLSSYFRGALSGLGFMNILVAFSEITGLRRFASQRSAEADWPRK